MKLQEGTRAWAIIASLQEEQNGAEAAKEILHMLIERSFHRLQMPVESIHNISINLPDTKELEFLQECDQAMASLVQEGSIEEAFSLFILYLSIVAEHSKLDITQLLSKILTYQYISKDHTLAQSVDTNRKFSNILSTKKFLAGFDYTFKDIKIPINKISEFQQSLGRGTRVDTPSNDTEEEFYSTSKAANRLGISDQTIRRMCEKGRFVGAYQTDGGHWRIPRSLFRTTADEDQTADVILKQIDGFTKGAGGDEVDEYNL